MREVVLELARRMEGSVRNVLAGKILLGFWSLPVLHLHVESPMEKDGCPLNVQEDLRNPKTESTSSETGEAKSK